MAEALPKLILASSVSHLPWRKMVAASPAASSLATAVYGRLFGAVEGQGLLIAADKSRSANDITIAVEQRYTLGLMGKVGFLPIPKLLVYGAFG